ncbi:hypothetical protein IGI04_042674 [Brassica rapa subsp. trilocularis]|uniref:Uncharacterized protein n=1 Tax=Brassica rapa subsp. trilocularis TaxID=1813537 RepID=A0ABQ7KHR9_BRACM|nr:hypothetical protein IGI04_042674 [Brassica rapa subsp. trilocularis]
MEEPGQAGSDNVGGSSRSEEQTETTTDEVEIQEAAPLDPEGGNQGEPPVSEEVHDQEEHHDQEEEVDDQNQNLEALPKGPMTRSRSRKLTQVIGGLVKRSWKQEECTNGERIRRRSRASKEE